MRVLIVDDHEAYAEVLTRRLRRKGCHPMRRATLQGALNAAKKHELGAVFVVPSLRGKSSSTLIEHLREYQPDTKVYMLLDQSDRGEPALQRMSVTGTRYRDEVSVTDMGLFSCQGLHSPNHHKSEQNGQDQPD